MKIVIDIPETFYKDCKECCELKWGGYYTSRLMNAIKNGKPLPKGHGDLIDRSKAIVNLMEYVKGNKTIGQCIDDTPTIIEADRECGE